MALQAITIDDRLYEVEKAQRSFMNSLIFPNGCLPSVEVIARNVARHRDLRMVDLEDITPHYAETLRRWRANVEAHTARLGEIGYDNRFQRLWRLYLSFWRRASPSAGSGASSWCWPSRAGAGILHRRSARARRPSSRRRADEPLPDRSGRRLGLRVAYGVGLLVARSAWRRTGSVPSTTRRRSRWRDRRARGGPARLRDRRRGARQAAAAVVGPASPATSTTSPRRSPVAAASRTARRRRPRRSRAGRPLCLPPSSLSSSLIAHSRVGSGEPLVLLHALGTDRHMWDPVIDRLAQEREVIAVDMPGFGGSSVISPPRPPIWPRDRPRTGARSPARGGQLARRVGGAGARAGGPGAVGDRDRARRAVGAAAAAQAIGRARSSPARCVPALPSLLRASAGAVALGGTIVHPERMPYAAALQLVRAYAEAPGFDAANAGMRAGRFTGLAEIRVPLTLAWPDHDRLVARPRSVPAFAHEFRASRVRAHAHLGRPRAGRRVLLAGSSLAPRDVELAAEQDGDAG